MIDKGKRFGKNCEVSRFLLPLPHNPLSCLAVRDPSLHVDPFRVNFYIGKVGTIDTGTVKEGSLTRRIPTVIRTDLLYMKGKE